MTGIGISQFISAVKDWRGAPAPVLSAWNLSKSTSSDLGDGFDAKSLKVWAGQLALRSTTKILENGGEFYPFNVGEIEGQDRCSRV